VALSVDSRQSPTSQNSKLFKVIRQHVLQQQQTICVHMTW